MKWIKAEDEMPESDPIRVTKGDGFTPDKSVKVLVYTDMGAVHDNFRVKMQVDKKEWVWFMNIEGEKITHWSRYLSPVID